jgi:beta-lactamase class A
VPAPDLAPLLEGFRGSVGLYARRLDTGEEITVDPDTPRPTASAAKQFVLLTFADQVTGGALDPDRRVELRDADIVVGSGVLRYCEPGLRPTLSDLAVLMMTISDNVATNLLLDAIGGPDVVNACMDRLGLPTARVHSPIRFDVADPVGFATASPHDLAGSFAVVADPVRVGIEPQAADLVRAVLRRHQHLDGLARHLPWSEHPIDFGVELPVTVYGKGGSYPGVVVDAALVTTGSTQWSVAVMCAELPEWRGAADEPAPRLCAEVGRKLWEAWGPEATT